MSWEAVSGITQIFGVIVVAVTLVYLAAQVRQGNILAKAQARQTMIECSLNELAAQMADPSITHANVKDGPLTAVEQARLSLFLIAFLRQREWEWFQFQDGVIGEDVYRAYHAVIPIHLGTARGRKWWAILGKYAFDASFVAEVDRQLATTEPSAYLRDIRTWDDAKS
jgi:hypothetical protein